MIIYKLYSLHLSSFKYRGSVIAKIIGTNAVNLTNINNEVKMYVFQETIGDRKLTDIINELHENVKYLPGIKLPENVVCI